MAEISGNFASLHGIVQGHDQRRKRTWWIDRTKNVSLGQRLHLRVLRPWEPASRARHNWAGRLTGTLYNTIVYLGADGRLLGKHRKLTPTYTERLVWGRGDGSTLNVVDLPQGRVGGLVCWEHWMPLARHAMHVTGEQIHAAL